MSTFNRTAARKHRQIRVRKRVHGVSERPRLAVYRSNRYIYAQVIDDVQGRTLAAASSQEPAMRGRSLNRETAAEVGRMLAERARAAGVETIVFDRGGNPYHGRVKALAEGAREGGLKF